MRLRFALCILARLVLGLSAFATLAAVTAVLVLKTGAANGLLRAELSRRAVNALDTRVTVARVSGDPLSRLTVTGLRVGAPGAAVLDVDTLMTRYRPLALLGGALSVDSLVVAGIRVDFRRRRALAEDQPALGASEAAAWWQVLEYDLASVEVRRARLRFANTDSSSDVRQLSASLRARATADTYFVELQRLQATVFDPPLRVTKPRGESVLTAGKLHMDGVVVRTAGSRLRLDGTVSGWSPPRLDARIVLDSLDLAEISRVLPGRYPDARVFLRTRIHGPLDSLRIRAAAAMAGAAGQLSGTVGRDTQGRVEYNLALGLRRAALEELWPGAGLAARGSLHARIQGRGLSLRSAQAEIEAGLRKGRMAGVEIDSGHVQARLARGRLNVTVTHLAVPGVAAAASFTEAGFSTELTAADRRYAAEVCLRGWQLGEAGRSLALTGAGEVWRAEEGAWRGALRADTLDVGGISLRDVRLEGAVDQGRVAIDTLWADTRGGAAGLRGTLELGRFWPGGSGPPAYDLHLAVMLQPSAFPVSGAASPSSGLAAGEPLPVQGHVRGEGFTPDALHAQAQICLGPGRVAGVALDRGRVVVRQIGTVTQVDSLWVQGPAVRLAGAGSVTPGDSVRLVLQGTIHHPERATPLTGYPVAVPCTRVDARIHGAWDEVRLAATARSDSVHFAGVRVDSVELHAQVPLSGSRHGELRIRASRAAASGAVLRQPRALVQLRGDTLDFDLDSRQGSRLFAQTRGQMIGTEGMHRLTVDSLVLGSGSLRLANQGRMRALCGPDGLAVRDTLVLAGGGGSVQVHGGTGAADTLWLRMDRVDLGRWQAALTGDSTAGGRLNARVRLSRLTGKPAGRAHLRVDEARWQRLALDGLSGDISWEDGVAQGELLARLPESGPLQMEFTVPRRAWRDSARINLRADSLALAPVLRILVPGVEQVSGLLEVQAEVLGVSRLPRMQGHVELRQGRARLLVVGQQFKQIAGRLEFQDRRVRLVGGRAQGGGGSLKVSGHLDLDSVLAYSAKLRARDLQAVERADLRATVDAELQLEGMGPSARLSGDVELQEGEVRIFDLTSDPLYRDLTRGSAPMGQESALDQLEVDLTINARRNVWIRDQDLDMEVAGRVDLRRGARGVRLFGMVESLQGTYVLQGTRFDIQRGELEFRGQTRIDPGLYLLASHSTRTMDGEELTIEAVVGGTIRAPEVTLQSEPPMSKEEIVSYLVFGGPGTGGAGGGLTGQLTGVAAGIAAAQLKHTIAQQLDLDVVILDAGSEGVRQVGVGEYIGEDLFVSYAREQHSGTTEIIVEYQLTPRLTLEAQQRLVGERQLHRQSLGLFWTREW